jgi:asparagine synthase (glutamine-hydrolysing)
MLDRRFLELALAVRSEEKRDGRLLGRLMTRLDPGLARLPLDSGLVPARLGRRGPATTAMVARHTAGKVVAKVRQRLAGARRPQLGAAEFARLVRDHWRAEPGTVDPLRRTGVVRAEWLDEVLDGRRDPQPTTVAMLINLLAAAGTIGDWRPGGRAANLAGSAGDGRASR